MINLLMGASLLALAKSTYYHLAIRRDYPPLIKKTVLTFLVKKKKYNKAF